MKTESPMAFARPRDGALFACLLLLVSCFLPLFIPECFAEEVEEAVTLDQLPAAVRATLEKETEGASIGEIEKETEEGKVVYEAEFTKDGKQYEVEIAADGKVLEVSSEGDDEEDDEAEDDDENELAEKISLDQVPPVVRLALEKETAGAVIGEIEKETEDGVVVYEAEFTKDGKDYEIEISADGKVLEVSEEAENDEEDENERLFTFEEVSAGTLPEGCVVKETHGQGRPGKWQVIEIEGAPSGKRALALTETKNSGQTYNLLLGQKAVGKDVGISVRVKSLSGQEDQGGGPVWRARDENNYYLARWNPLENNVRVYFVKEGKRSQIASAEVTADPAEWHELEIEMEGDRIECEFDGKPLLDLQDTTFQEPGMLGLWTKADAATAFDNVEVEIEE